MSRGAVDEDLVSDAINSTEQGGQRGDAEELTRGALLYARYRKNMQWMADVFLTPTSELGLDDETEDKEDRGSTSAPAPDKGVSSADTASDAQTSSSHAGQQPQTALAEEYYRTLAAAIEEEIQATHQEIEELRTSHAERVAKRNHEVEAFTSALKALSRIDSSEQLDHWIKQATTASSAARSGVNPRSPMRSRTLPPNLAEAVRNAVKRGSDEAHHNDTGDHDTDVEQPFPVKRRKDLEQELSKAKAKEASSSASAAEEAPSIIQLE